MTAEQAGEAEVTRYIRTLRLQRERAYARMVWAIRRSPAAAEYWDQDRKHWGISEKRARVIRREVAARLGQREAAEPGGPAAW